MEARKPERGHWGGGASEEGISRTQMRGKQKGRILKVESSSRDGKLGKTASGQGLAKTKCI